MSARPRPYKDDEKCFLSNLTPLGVTYADIKQFCNMAKESWTDDRRVNVGTKVENGATYSFMKHRGVPYYSLSVRVRATVDVLALPQIRLVRVEDGEVKPVCSCNGCRFSDVIKALDVSNECTLRNGFLDYRPALNRLMREYEDKDRTTAVNAMRELVKTYNVYRTALFKEMMR